MNVLRALVGGCAELSRSSRLVFVVWLAVVLAALPGTLLLEESIRADLGSSVMHRQLVRGIDLDWLEEYHHRQPETGRLLEPVRVSPVMWLENLELWLSGEWIRADRKLATGALCFLLVWIGIQAGVFAHLAAAGESFEWRRFGGSVGGYFWRFLRIALMAGVAYFGVYRLARWLFPAIEIWTRDWATERSVLALNLLAAALIVVLICGVHLIAEFSRISTIRQSRRSMLLALVRSAGAVLRHPAEAFGILSLTSLLLLLWQIAYSWVVPGAHLGGWRTALVAVAVGQVYLIGRWALRLARIGAEIRLYDRWVAAANSSRRRPES